MEVLPKCQIQSCCSIIMVHTICYCFFFCITFCSGRKAQRRRRFVLWLSDISKTFRAFFIIAKDALAVVVCVAALDLPPLPSMYTASYKWIACWSPMHSIMGTIQRGQWKLINPESGRGLVSFLVCYYLVAVRKEAVMWLRADLESKAASVRRGPNNISNQLCIWASTDGMSVAVN